MTTDQGWLRSTVFILVDREENPRRQQVVGWTNRKAPGLAVTPSTSHDPTHRVRHSITHTLTGREIAEGATEHDAKRIALDVAQLANWDQPLEAITVDPVELSNSVQRIAEAGRHSARLRPGKLPSKAAEYERRAVRYLLDAARIHEATNDDTAAARIRGALSHLEQ